MSHFQEIQCPVLTSWVTRHIHDIHIYMQAKNTYIVKEMLTKIMLREKIFWTMWSKSHLYYLAFGLLWLCTVPGYLPVFLAHVPILFLFPFCSLSVWLYAWLFFFQIVFLLFKISFLFTGNIAPEMGQNFMQASKLLWIENKCVWLHIRLSLKQTFSSNSSWHLQYCGNRQSLVHVRINIFNLRVSRTA